MYSESLVIYAQYGLSETILSHVYVQMQFCVLWQHLQHTELLFPVQIGAVAAPIWTLLIALCWTLTLRSCAVFLSQTTMSMPVSSVASIFKVGAVLYHFRPPHTTSLHNSGVSPFFPPRAWPGIPRLHSQCPSGSPCLPKLAHPQGDSS